MLITALWQHLAVVGFLFRRDSLVGVVVVGAQLMLQFGIIFNPVEDRSHEHPQMGEAGRENPPLMTEQERRRVRRHYIAAMLSGGLWWLLYNYIAPLAISVRRRRDVNFKAALFVVAVTVHARIGWASHKAKAWTAGAVALTEHLLLHAFVKHGCSPAVCTAPALQ